MSTETPELKPVYAKINWKKQQNDNGVSAHDVLLKWMTNGKNFEMYIGNSADGNSKGIMLQQIAKYLEENGIQGRSTKSIRSKMDRTVETYYKALRWVNQTGQGISKITYIENDPAANLAKQQEIIKAEVLKICEEFYDINPVAPAVIPSQYDNEFKVSAAEDGSNVFDLECVENLNNNNVEDPKVNTLNLVDKVNDANNAKIIRNVENNRRIKNVRKLKSARVDNVLPSINNHENDFEDSQNDDLELNSDPNQFLSSFMDLNRKRLRLDEERERFQMRLAENKRKLDPYEQLTEYAKDLHRDGIISLEELQKKRLEIFEAMLLRYKDSSTSTL